MQDVGDDRAGDADRIDAVVRIEAPVLDRDEGLRHVARQVLERDRGAAHVAARGEQLAVQVDDLDRRRALGNFQRLDRRQVRADPDRAADRRRSPPRGRHRAPIGDPADASTGRRRRRLPLLAALALGALAAGCGLGGGAGRRRLSSAGSDAGAASNTGSRRSLAFGAAMSVPQTAPAVLRRARPASSAGYGARFKGRLSQSADGAEIPGRPGFAGASALLRLPPELFPNAAFLCIIPAYRGIRWINSLGIHMRKSHFWQRSSLAAAFSAIERRRRRSDDQNPNTTSSCRMR